jgi:hypothetical protein
MASTAPNFLSLPRELRDHIYHFTLHNQDGPTLTPLSSLATNAHRTWVPKRDSHPGMYRPVKHYHNFGCTCHDPTQAQRSLNMRPFGSWKHATRVVRMPALFHVSRLVRAEAMAAYMARNIMLESNSDDDFPGQVKVWAATMGEKSLDVIQHLYLYTRVTFDFPPHEGAGDEEIHQKLCDLKLAPDRTYKPFDLVDPMFRIALGDGG